MAKNKSKKICIVVLSLGGGGAERSSALLSEMLFDLGYEVHIVSVLNQIDFPYRGKFLNLGELKDKDDSSLGRFKRLLVFKRYLKHHQFDYIIDSRTRIGFLKEFVISKWAYRKENVINYIHSYKISNYINPNRQLGRLLYNSVESFVCVSKEIEDKLKQDYSFKNTNTIYNAINDGLQNQITDHVSNEKYVLFYGRLDEKVKNITLLIEAYAASRLKDLSIKLKILGDGQDKGFLEQKVKDLNLSSYVEFLNFNPNPFDVVSKAYFTVLTSRYEGFPMVITESLSLGVPVVSVNCKSGPKEIIIDEYNGLLVENYNVGAFAKAMNRMIEDNELYLRCKENAAKSVQEFSKASISKQWKAFLN